MLPGGDRLADSVRALQRDGAVVMLVSGDRPALGAADCGLGVAGPEELPPWGAHLLVGADLRMPALVIEAAGVARRMTEQNIAPGPGRQRVSARSARSPPPPAQLPGRPRRGQRRGRAGLRARRLAGPPAARPVETPGAGHDRLAPDAGRRPCCDRLDTGPDGLTSAEAQRRQARQGPSGGGAPAAAVCSGPSSRSWPTRSPRCWPPGRCSPPSFGSLVDAALVGGVVGGSALVGAVQRARHRTVAGRAAVPLGGDRPGTPRRRRAGGRRRGPRARRRHRARAGRRRARRLPGARGGRAGGRRVLADRRVAAGRPRPTGRWSPRRRRPALDALRGHHRRRRTRHRRRGGHRRATPRPAAAWRWPAQAAAGQRGGGPARHAHPRRHPAGRRLGGGGGRRGPAARRTAGRDAGDRREPRRRVGARGAAVPGQRGAAGRRPTARRARRAGPQPAHHRGARPGRRAVLRQDRHPHRGQLLLAGVGDGAATVRPAGPARRPAAAGARRGAAGHPRRRRPEELAHPDRPGGPARRRRRPGWREQTGAAGWRRGRRAAVRAVPRLPRHASGETDGRLLLSVKGAPEMVLPRCAPRRTDGGRRSRSTTPAAPSWTRMLADRAGAGHRVLAVAERQVDDPTGHRRDVAGPDLRRASSPSPTGYGTAPPRRSAGSGRPACTPS